MKEHRRAKVLFRGEGAGILEQTDAGFRFVYEPDFIEGGEPIAVSFPLQKEPFQSAVLFPFFEGLLPEGWFREIVCRTLKIDDRDHFGILLGTCVDCIGAVSVERLDSEDAPS